MREIHGVVAAVQGEPGKTQHVRVTDSVDGICLVHTSSNAAILTSEEARFIAKQLVAAANRLDKGKA
jgi:hypothetical protein